MRGRRHQPAPVISDKALREAHANLSRPLRVLPASWWDSGVAERMSEWIKHSKSA